VYATQPHVALKGGCLSNTLPFKHKIIALIRDIQAKLYTQWKAWLLPSEFIPFKHIYIFQYLHRLHSSTHTKTTRKFLSTKELSEDIIV